MTFNVWPSFQDYRICESRFSKSRLSPTRKKNSVNPNIVFYLMQGVLIRVESLLLLGELLPFLLLSCEHTRTPILNAPLWLPLSGTFTPWNISSKISHMNFFIDLGIGENGKFAKKPWCLWFLIFLQFFTLHSIQQIGSASAFFFFLKFFEV